MTAFVLDDDRSRRVAVTAPSGVQQPRPFNAMDKGASAPETRASLDMLGAQGVPALPVPEHARGRRGEMAPLDKIVVRDFVAEERVHRNAETGCGCGMPIGDQLRKTVEEQVTRRRSLWWRRRRSRRSRDLGQKPARLERVAGGKSTPARRPGTSRARAGRQVARVSWRPGPGRTGASGPGLDAYWTCPLSRSIRPRCTSSVATARTSANRPRAASNAPACI